MNEVLIKNWNSKVSPEDIVFHLGDFSFGHKDKIKQITDQLNGIIFLIKGNHDVKEYLEECGIFVIEGQLFYKNYILTHYPLPKEEIPEGYINLHGHIHHNESFHGINVSVEKTNFSPISLTQVLELKR